MRVKGYTGIMERKMEAILFWGVRVRPPGAHLFRISGQEFGGSRGAQQRLWTAMLVWRAGRRARDEDEVVGFAG